MKLKNPAIGISDNNPFADDALDRRKLAEAYYQIFKDVSEPLVCAIDSPWGTGKTTFINMFLKYLENQKINCIYFNAWENDYVDDPLIPFIDEIEIIIENKNKDQDGKLKSIVNDVINKVKNTGGMLIKNSLPAVLKLATYGLINFDKSTEDEIAKVVENITKNELEKYKVQKQSIKDFKENLKELVKNLNNGGEEEKPLIIFIDELDRCRPNFAIELLERVKHLFNIDGIIFVLGIDREQLCHSIRTIYGLNMDVDGYLKKFIDLNFCLPKLDYKNYIGILFKRYNFDEYFERRNQKFSYNEKQFIEFFTNLAKTLKLTLRSIEHCFTQFSISFRLIPENHKINIIVLVTLVCLKISNSELYYGYINKKYNELKILEYLKGINNSNEIFETNYGIALEIYFMDEANEINKLKEEYNKKMRSDNLKEQNKGKLGWDIINEITTTQKLNLKSIIEKIEMMAVLR